jgi:hypothetical protein
MSRLALLLGCFLAIGSAPAQTMYKCQVDGRIEYSGMPCAEGVELKRLAPDGGPTQEDRARAQMRVKAEQQKAEAQNRVEADLRRRLAETADPARAQRR